VALVLASCTASDEPLRPTGDLRSARQQLDAQGEMGPVPLAIIGPPSGLTPARLAELAAAGVHGSSVRFDPGAAARWRTVLWFDPPPDAVDPCGTPPSDAVLGSDRPTVLLAAYCDGDQPVATARERLNGTGLRAVERMVWQATEALFPDDYADTYGINLFGIRLRLGASAGF
jgi:hypothetical protein